MNTQIHAPQLVDSVPLLDVTRGNDPLRAEILEAIAQVYDSGRFINGPDCRTFEESIVQFCESKFAIGCASGSDALLLALMACDVGPGDEVVIPSFTFFATASAVTRLGATPVFADIDPVTFNVDPAAVEDAIGPKTKAVIPVHLFGQCADMDPILKAARRHEVPVIEDAAQAIGAKYRGRPAGSLGDIGCFSFYPTKNLGAMGDGGVLTTNDQAFNDRLRRLAAHGMNKRYYHSEVGVNSRLDSMQAALLNIKLRHLDRWSAARQQNATKYYELFCAFGLGRIVDLPQASTDCEHVWNQFTIRIRDGQRDELRSYLADAKIGTEIYYPVPMHQQECFSELPKIELSETERASREVLSLPIFPELTGDEQRTVVSRIASFFAENTQRLAS